MISFWSSRAIFKWTNYVRRWDLHFQLWLITKSTRRMRISLSNVNSVVRYPVAHEYHRTWHITDWLDRYNWNYPYTWIGQVKWNWHVPNRNCHRRDIFQMAGIRSVQAGGLDVMLSPIGTTDWRWATLGATTIVLLKSEMSPICKVKPATYTFVFDTKLGFSWQENFAIILFLPGWSLCNQIIVYYY